MTHPQLPPKIEFTATKGKEVRTYYYDSVKDFQPMKKRLENQGFVVTNDKPKL